MKSLQVVKYILVIQGTTNNQILRRPKSSFLKHRLDYRWILKESNHIGGLSQGIGLPLFLFLYLSITATANAYACSNGEIGDPAKPRHKNGIEEWADPETSCFNEIDDCLLSFRIEMSNKDTECCTRLGVRTAGSVFRVRYGTPAWFYDDSWRFKCPTGALANK